MQEDTKYSKNRKALADHRVTLCFSQEMCVCVLDIDTLKKEKEKKTWVVASPFFLFMKPEHMGDCNRPAVGERLGPQGKPAPG